MIQRAMHVSAVSFLLALAACSSKAGDDDSAGGSGGTSGTGAGATGGTSSGSGATGGTSAGTGATGGSMPGSGTGGMATGGTVSASGGSGGGASGMGGMPGGAGLGSAGTPGTMCGTTIVAGKADNYTFHSELSINVTKVGSLPAPGMSKLHFDWSAVTTDMLGHPVNLNDIGMVEIGLWNLTLDQFEKKLNDDALAQSDLSIIATILPAMPGVATGNIYQLTETGQQLTPEQIDPFLDITKYAPENHIYTAMVANGTDLGQGTRMIQGFQLDASSTNDLVTINNDSTKLTMTADLHSLVSPQVPAGTPNITINWKTVPTTGSGLEFDPTQITKLRVGKYSISAAEMEQPSNFLNLDSIADTMYTAPINSGTSIDLSVAKDANANPFPGIDDTHTWIVALNCGSCANPAPWYMTVLKPCAAAK